MNVNTYADAVSAVLVKLGTKASKYCPAKYGFEDADKYFVQLLENPPILNKLGGYSGSFVRKSDGKVWSESLPIILSETKRMTTVVYKNGIWYE